MTVGHAMPKPELPPGMRSVTSSSASKSGRGELHPPSSSTRSEALVFDYGSHFHAPHQCMKVHMITSNEPVEGSSWSPIVGKLDGPVIGVLETSLPRQKAKIVDTDDGEFLANLLEGFTRQASHSKYASPTPAPRTNKAVSRLGGVLSPIELASFSPKDGGTPRCG